MPTIKNGEEWMDIKNPKFLKRWKMYKYFFLNKYNI